MTRRRCKQLAGLLHCVKEGQGSVEMHLYAQGGLRMGCAHKVADYEMA